MVGVTVEDPAARWPRPGDAVLVAWGLDTVNGLVIETYATGAKPRVLVELDPSEIGGDESKTLTVPLEAIEPTEGAKSPWAEHARYEKRVAEALARVIGEPRSRLEKNKEFDAVQLDLLVRTKSGEVLAVEVKQLRSPMTTRSLQAVSRQLREVTSARGWYGLLVTDRDLPGPGGEVLVLRPGLAAVVWRDEGDDGRLRDALTGVFGRPIARSAR